MSRRSWQPVDSLPRNSEVVLIGDLLSDPKDIAAMIDSISQRGARGHLTTIADPVEETFPSLAMSSSSTSTRWRACALGEAELSRADYVRRLTAHRHLDWGGRAGARLDLDAAPDRPPGFGGVAGAQDAA